MIKIQFNSYNSFNVISSKFINPILILISIGYSNTLEVESKLHVINLNIKFLYHEDEFILKTL